MKEEKYCPCCPNQCSVEHLQCQRGENYFSHGQQQGPVFKDEALMTLDEKVIHKIRECGHLLHHGGNIHLEHLNEDEKEQLIQLLCQCLK